MGFLFALEVRRETNTDFLQRIKPKNTIFKHFFQHAGQCSQERRRNHPWMIRDSPLYPADVVANFWHSQCSTRPQQASRMATKFVFIRDRLQHGFWRYPEQDLHGNQPIPPDPNPDSSHLGFSFSKEPPPPPPPGPGWKHCFRDSFSLETESLFPHQRSSQRALRSVARHCPKWRACVAGPVPRPHC